MFAKNQALIIPFAIFLFALLIRLLFILLLGAEPKVYDALNDQYIYLDLAKSITAGRGLSMSFPIFVADAFKPTAIETPVYPLLIASVFSIFGQSLLAIRILQAGLGAAVAVIVYLIAKQILAKNIAVVAALLVAIYPPLVMYIRPIMTETLYSFLLALIVLLLVKFTTGTFRPIHYLSWGVLFGLTMLVRPEIITLIPLIVIFTVAWTVIHKQTSLQRLGAGLVLAGLIGGVLVGAWAIRNSMAMGQAFVFPTKQWSTWESNVDHYNHEQKIATTRPDCGNNELVCAIPNFAALTELERDHYAANLAQQFIFSHPVDFIRYSVGRVLTSYPLIPREELPGPFGYKDLGGRPDDGYDATSLDDVAFYLSPAEKINVWSFRLVFVLAAMGIVIGLKRRQWQLLVPGLIVFFNVGNSLLLLGSERYRVTADPYLIIIASYGLIQLVDYARSAFARRRKPQMTVELERF